MLYGERPSAAEYLCIFVHDLGYLGCKDMDGEHGKFHPKGGARLAALVLGSEYWEMVAGHSVSYAKMMGIEPSKLAAADKLAMAEMPAWMYNFLVKLTGEWLEYYDEACSYMENGCIVAGFQNCKSDASRLKEWAAWCRLHLRRLAHRLAAPYTSAKPPCSPDRQTSTVLRQVQGHACGSQSTNEQLDSTRQRRMIEAGLEGYAKTASGGRSLDSLARALATLSRKKPGSRVPD